MCIIVSVLLLTLLVAYIVTSRMDRKKEEALQREEEVEETQNTENQDIFSIEMYSPGHFANNQETVASRNWTGWCKNPYINYIEETEEVEGV